MNSNHADAAPTPPRPGDTSVPAPGWCLNCDSELHGEYCSRCGQRNTTVSASLRTLAGEFADEYLSLDARFFRSVVALCFRPGFLTRQYLIGRRERYVRPLRLYIVASLLFFFAVPLVIQINVEGTQSVRDLIREEGGDSVFGDAPADTGAPPGEALGPEAIGAVGTIRIAGRSVSLQEHAERVSRMTPQQLIDTLVEGFERYLPRMMFVLLPVFALILKVLYLRRRWYYAEHFIFALHFHAFAFGLFLLLLILPSGIWNQALALWGIAYLAVAMQRVYRQPVWKTGAKFLLLAGSYSVLLMLAFVSSLLLSILLM